MKTYLKCNRRVLVVRWKDRAGHTHICHVHGFHDEHIGLLGEYSADHDGSFEGMVKVVEHLDVSGLHGEGVTYGRGGGFKVNFD